MDARHLRRHSNCERRLGLESSTVKLSVPHYCYKKVTKPTGSWCPTKVNPSPDCVPADDHLLPGFTAGVPARSGGSLSGANASTFN